jgi:hypothetical protein
MENLHAAPDPGRKEAAGLQEMTRTERQRKEFRQMRNPSTKIDRDRSEADILGLESHDNDPVRIILAAQLQLRRCRRGQAVGRPCTAAEVRRIIAARDALLSRAVGSLSRLATGFTTGGRLTGPAATASETASAR